jgi:hypothetical protein
MKHRIQWLKDELKINIEMTIGEAMTIMMCVAALISIITICITRT